MSKGYYIADPKGEMKSPVYTVGLKAKDICKDRNEAVKKASGGDIVCDYYHIVECEIDGEV